MLSSARNTYRNQIRDALSQSGWEITRIDNETDWWADEHWTISSTAQAFGSSLIISYLVDPTYEGRDKSSAISEIVVHKTQPQNRLDDESKVAELDMRKGHFGTKLSRFVLEINRHRDSI